MYKIESVDHYGKGITHINNKITFVKNALPNEIVELNINKETSKYNEAVVTKYIEKSNYRCNTKCKYYDYCGGCNIMHLNYEDQLKFKQDKIKNIIHKYLDDNIIINNIIKSDNCFNYRNKVTFQVKENIGFYNDNSYDFVEIDNCPISHKLINASIKYLKKLDLKYVNKITCRAASDNLMVIIETSKNDLNIDCIKEISSSIYLKCNDKYILAFGDKYIYETLENYKYMISPDSFFQINIDVCNKLYNKINEYVGINKNVLDLYCGTGSIGIYVSKNNNVVGIEKNKFAIQDANKNITLNHIKNVNFICGDSAKETKNLNFNPDIVIVDPPRSGLNKETITNVLKFKADEIIYVSCNPMTLVRDLKILNSIYNIIEITPFDMFPNTYHVETITRLKKRKKVYNYK